jgi:EAL domain-containing protein (putative c-di-GMP-specific phosphodiesterase class I)
MYQAKGAGMDRVEVFSEATRLRILRRLELEQRLRAALAAGALAVHYQPQVDLASGRLVGVEALARWDQAAPDEFIPLAEETGLIGPLGAWVLRTACRDLAAWHAAGLKPFTATVNVSTRQLEDPDFPQTVARAFADAGLAPSAICLELTESALMGAGEASLDVLRAVKDLGVYIAIDDFGTGHSSLARLRRLPVEVLKVDRSFVDGLGTEPEDSAVVAAILSLAHALGLHVIAEGVETPLQAHQLTALGCPVAQGFLWSAAVPAARVPELAARGTAVQPRLAGYRGEPGLVDEMMHQIGVPKEGMRR